MCDSFDFGNWFLRLKGEEVRVTDITLLFALGPSGIETSSRNTEPVSLFGKDSLDLH